MQKIIFVPYLTAFGGVERLILDLSRYLEQQAVAHTVVCFRDTINLPSFTTWPLRVRQLRPVRNPVSETISLVSWLRSQPEQSSAPLLFDLKGAFHAGLIEIPPFNLHLTDPPSLLPTDVSKYARSARKVMPRSELDKGIHWSRRLRGEAVHFITRRGVNRARAVFTMTNSISEEVKALYGVDSQVIRPGVRACASPRREDHTFNFLSVSRLEPNKRLEWILRAFAALDARSPPLRQTLNWRFNVVGEGSQREPLRNLAMDLGISQRVHFLGRLSDQELEDVFTTTHTFLMPAYQGYGLPALDALARGVPVVMHRQSGASELFPKSPWVELIESGTDDITDPIMRMTERILSGVLDRTVRPSLPTSTEWASAISVACGWRQLACH